MTRAQFEARYADPANLFYKRQSYYDSSPEPKHCAICDRPIRHCFILRTQPDRALPPIGTCCFPYFEQWNPKLHGVLIAAAIDLDNYLEATQHDVALYGKLATAKERMARWREVKRRAFTEIRKFRKISGEKTWLPKPLHDLKEEADKRPTTEYKNLTREAQWYEKQVHRLEERLKQIQPLT